MRNERAGVNVRQSRKLFPGDCVNQPPSLKNERGGDESRRKRWQDSAHALRVHTLDIA